MTYDVKIVFSNTVLLATTTVFPLSSSHQGGYWTLRCEDGSIIYVPYAHVLYMEVKESQ